MKLISSHEHEISGLTITVQVLKSNVKNEYCNYLRKTDHKLFILNLILYNSKNFLSS